MRPLGLILIALIGCGGSPARAPLEGRGGAAGGEIATLQALAAAARADDGAALAALVHPVHGAVLWHQPGVRLAPFAVVKPGDRRRPSAHLTDLEGWWREHYWRQVAAGLDAGLTRLDREPADPHAAIYGSCDPSEHPAAPRATLRAGQDVEAHEQPVALRRDLVQLHHWGLDVYLAAEGGRWWVAHVMVWTPCDA